MRRFLLLALLLGPTACRSRVQVPSAPRVYASEAEKAKVAEISDSLGSYEDDSLNEQYERQTIRVIHYDLDQMDETSPTWPDNLKKLRADMDTLVDLDRLLNSQIVL